jgi:hypothetical protein
MIIMLFFIFIIVVSEIMENYIYPIQTQRITSSEVHGKQE